MECPLHGIGGSSQVNIECIHDVNSQNADNESSDMQSEDVEIVENDSYEIFSDNEVVHTNEVEYDTNGLN